MEMLWCVGELEREKEGGGGEEWYKGARNDKERGWKGGREGGTAFISPTPLVRQWSRC